MQHFPLGYIILNWISKMFLFYLKKTKQKQKKVQVFVIDTYKIQTENASYFFFSFYAHFNQYL